jgi:hypothetical protein
VGNGNLFARKGQAFPPPRDTRNVRACARVVRVTTARDTFELVRITRAASTSRTKCALNTTRSGKEGATSLIARARAMTTRATARSTEK